MDKIIYLNEDYFLHVKICLYSDMSKGISEFQIKTAMYDRKLFKSFEETIQELRGGYFITVPNKPLNLIQKITSGTSSLEKYLLDKIDDVIGRCQKIADQCKSNSSILKACEVKLHEYI